MATISKDEGLRCVQFCFIAIYYLQPLQWLRH